MVSEVFPPPLWKEAQLSKISIMRLAPLVIKEEDYEEPSCNTSCRSSRDGVDDLLPPSYDVSIWKKIQVV